MARKIQVMLEDDLDGTNLGADGGETVTFSLDGATYEIDLSDKNAKAMRDAFGRYVQHARKATTGRRGGHMRRAASGGGSSRDETKAARAWLVEQGILSADSRGRISEDNWEKYRQRGQMSVPTSAPSLQETKGEVPGTGGADKPVNGTPRGNSQKPEKAPAKGNTPETSGVASLLP